MLLKYNPNDYEVVMEHYICPFHKKNPETPYAGCTCSSSYSCKKKDNTLEILTEYSEFTPFST